MLEVRDYVRMSALELLRAIRTREISPVEVVDCSLRRIEEVEPRINAFAHVTGELALDAARAAEGRVRDRGSFGALVGLPVSIKDLIPVAAVPCEFGSRTMVGNVPSEDGVVVKRIKGEGACIIGKTTTSEFGCKAVGDSPLTGITRNPVRLDRTPGGSSSGTAASVAAGVSPFGIATDGGGSVRIPASLTGTFGIKPQHGRVPFFPSALTPTLAHVGPIARTVRDAALLLTAMSGFDGRDPFAIAGPVPDFLGACEQSSRGLRIAWSPTLGFAKPNREVIEVVSDAVRALEADGCEVQLVENVMEDPEDIWNCEFFVRAAHRLREILPSNSEKEMDQAVHDILSKSAEVSLTEYFKASTKREIFRNKMVELFKEYDLLASPTLPVTAFAIGKNVPTNLEGRSIVSWVYYTYPFNLTGQPAASVPAGVTSEGLPVGLHLVAGMHREVDIFRVSATLEAIRPWNRDLVISH